MTIRESAEQAGTSLFVAAVVAVVGGISYLLRVIFTNKREIELLTAALQNIATSRDEDRMAWREDVTEVKDRLKNIESSLMHHEAH
jgi:hypothetical protein